MKINRWTIPSGDAGREEWLQRRHGIITGSKVGALFGCSPFLTPYALYAQEAGLAPPADKDNKAMKRGRVMEPSILAALHEDYPDWHIWKAGDYLWSDDWRLGCTPDFYVTHPERGRGVIQGKTVAKPIFEAEWADGPPLWVLLQNLLEMKLDDAKWGAVAAFVMSSYDYELHLFEFERHPEAEERIIVRAAEFWAAVKAGVEPKPNYAEDGEIIRAMFPRDNGTTIDLSSDNRLPELLEAFETLSADEKSAAKELKAVKAEIAAKLGDAAAASLPGWQVTMKTVERAGYEVKPTSFRQLRVKRTEERQAAA